MLRLRWFEPQPTGQPKSVEWRSAAPIIATVFFSFDFWFTSGIELRMARPILPYTLLVAAVSTLTTALFFAAPASLTRKANVPIHQVVENSVGSIPAFGIRISSISFLVLWMANTISFPAFWWVDQSCIGMFLQTTSG